MIRPENETSHDRHGTPHQDQKTEEFEKEIEERTNGTCFEGMSERKDWDAMAPFHEVARGDPFDHVNNKGRDKPKDEKGVRQPAVKRLTEKLSMEEDVYDEDPEIPCGSSFEALPAPEKKGSLNSPTEWHPLPPQSPPGDKG